MSEIGNVFLAVTTVNGTVHTTTRDLGTGKWSPFEAVPSLAGRKNTAVTGRTGEIFATDDARRPRVAYTRHVRSWSAPTTVLTGFIPVSANQAATRFTGVLAVGSTGTEYNLPLYAMELGSTTPVSRGDQVMKIGKGPLNLTDFPADIAMEGVLESRHETYQVCLATESGGLFFGSTRTPASPFLDLKIACGDPGLVRSVSCAEAVKAFHVCIVNDAGVIQHASRDASGRWSRFAAVSGQAGTRFVRVAVRGFNGVEGVNPLLHLVGVTDSGGLLHTTLDSGGTWQPFANVKADAGDPGNVTSHFVDVLPWEAA